MRQRARTDGNHANVVKALRQIGASVQDLSAVGKGCPDIVVGYHGRTFLLEIKDGDKTPGNRTLTVMQVDWHARWGGQVAIVTTPEEAQLYVIREAKDGV